MVFLSYWAIYCSSLRIIFALPQVQIADKHINKHSNHSAFWDGPYGRWGISESGNIAGTQMDRWHCYLHSVIVCGRASRCHSPQLGLTQKTFDRARDVFMRRSQIPAPPPGGNALAVVSAAPWYVLLMGRSASDIPLQGYCQITPSVLWCIFKHSCTPAAWGKLFSKLRTTCTCLEIVNVGFMF